MSIMITIARVGIGKILNTSWTYYKFVLARLAMSTCASSNVVGIKKAPRQSSHNNNNNDDDGDDDNDDNYYYIAFHLLCSFFFSLVYL